MAGDPDSLEQRVHITIVAKVVRVDDRCDTRIPGAQPDGAPAVRLQRRNTDQIGVRDVEPDDRSGIDEQNLQVWRSAS
jgi:hypothetical protein